MIQLLDWFEKLVSAFRFYSFAAAKMKSAALQGKMPV
jgi:hypothetical protein